MEIRLVVVGPTRPGVLRVPYGRSCAYSSARESPLNQILT